MVKPDELKEKSCASAKFLGAFAILGKTNISFVMSVSLCPSAYQQLSSHWMDFYEIFYT